MRKRLFAALVGCLMGLASGALVTEAVAEKPGPSEKSTRVERSAEQRSTARKSRRSRAAQQEELSVIDPAGDETFEKLQRTEEEWRDALSREEFRILRMKGTEAPFRNKYDHHFEPGKYVCAACGLVLFKSDTKFNSGCGWPAFYAAKAEDRIVRTVDLTHGMVRTEVTCARCGGHLGHVFEDAPQTPTGERYCINSVSIKFVRDEEEGEKSKSKPREEKE